jgi:hypothetical protein
MAWRQTRQSGKYVNSQKICNLRKISIQILACSSLAFTLAERPYGGEAVILADKGYAATTWCLTPYKVYIFYLDTNYLLKLIVGNIKWSAGRVQKAL